MPEVKCVISMAIHINYALVDSLRRQKSVYSYMQFSNYVMDKLDELAYEVAQFLENQGFSAYPVSAIAPNNPVELKGDISHKHTAVAAGLGEIGWNNLFLSPQFGPRQRLTSVITDARLEPTPLLQERLCKPAECGFKCAVCPSKSISRSEKITFEIDNRQYEQGAFSSWRCMWGCGSLSSVMPMPEVEPSIEELRIGRIAQEMEKFKKRGSLTEATANSLFYTRINKKEVPWCWQRCMTRCPVGETKPLG
jgi:epoxyqueuosine reductase QueG